MSEIVSSDAADAGVRRSLTDTAISKIRELIIEGTLGPGQKLPPEKVLASELGLSRNSLREAVRALSQQGVFVTRQGDGTYVTSLRPEVLLSSIGFAIDLLQDDHVWEVFELRRIIEPAGTALAAQRIDAPALIELASLLDAFDRADDWEQMVNFDIAFHNAIMEATGNVTLHSLAVGLSQQTLRARVWRGLADEGTTDITRRQHRAILRALEAHDAVSAHAVAYSHVADTEDWLRRHYAQPCRPPGQTSGGSTAPS